MATDFTKKNEIKYCCENCDFFTSKKTDYVRHLTTRKHKQATFATEKTNKTTIHSCDNCDKEFHDRSGLWRHRKKCANMNAEYYQKIDNLTNVVLDVINKNSELTKQIIELTTKPTITNINSNNNNINKTFNLQVFLNEECKNAINLRDFVESIQVQLSDLEYTGQVGYVEGISKIFINNLGNLNKHDRPIHCSDYKREILYIKNDNEWIKETGERTTIKNAIKHVANKNIKKIKQWQETHPEFNDPTSRQNDKYMRLLYNSMSGSTEEEQKTNINKIIKNITKEVIIEKDMNEKIP
jgi:hypothetical protein